MTAPDSSTIIPPSAPAAKTPGLWEDFIDIFVSPTEVFERRRNAGFAVPLLVFAVLFTILAIVARPALAPVFDAEFARGAAAAMRKNPQITPDQMARTRAMTEKFQAIGFFLSGLITPLVIGLVLWIAGKFVDAKEDIRAACVVATYAYFPRLLEWLVSVAQGFALDPASLNGRYRLSLGAGRFLDPDTASPVLLALLGRLDVFTIWVTILLAIGLSVVGRIPRSRAAVAAAVVWLVGAIPGLLTALRAS